MWNELPADTKQASSLNSFEKSILEFFLFSLSSFMLDFVNIILGFYNRVLYCNFSFSLCNRRLR